MGKNNHIHFIAIGGSAMHNLAIALADKGFQVTGSDDDIFEPAKSRLYQKGLLPEKTGWFPEKIGKDIKAVILGMHARTDNPELKAAQHQGIRIYSFPEYIYEVKKEATRIVIAGSHGKSTITSMISYVLSKQNRDFDYLIGAGIPGFENMVRITDAPLMVLEGDEYLSSPVDPTPKFIRYRHQIGLLSGIAWDHINAFPTREIYTRQFEDFVDNTPDDGTLIYNEEDETVNHLVRKKNLNFQAIPYRTPSYEVMHEKFCYRLGKESIPLNFFGRHNMLNLSGAISVLKLLGFEEKEIVDSIKSFSGAANRLEKIYDQNNITVFKDFAHSPSKLRSTVRAINELYPERKIINCFELHTYSSLNRNFLPEYTRTLPDQNLNIVFLNDHTLMIKKMEYLEDKIIRQGFDLDDLVIIRNTADLVGFISGQAVKNSVLLLMSSGNFGGLDYEELITSLENKH